MYESYIPSLGKRNKENKTFNFRELAIKLDSANWIKDSKWYQRRVRKAEKEKRSK